MVEGQVAPPRPSLYFTKNTTYINYKEESWWEIINLCRTSWWYFYHLKKEKMCRQWYCSVLSWPGKTMKISAPNINYAFWKHHNLVPTLLSFGSIILNLVSLEILFLIFLAAHWALLPAVAHHSTACSGPPLCCLQWPTTLLPAVVHHSTACSGPPLCCLLWPTTLLPAVAHHSTACSGPPLCCLQWPTTLLPAVAHHSTAFSGPPLCCLQWPTSLQPAVAHHSAACSGPPLCRLQWPTTLLSAVTYHSAACSGPPLARRPNPKITHLCRNHKLNISR
jgi:hypothetical protein